MKTSGSVLVVDDEEGIRALLKSELTGRGYHVVSAANGEEALRRLADQPFQVALCDIRMPELDGMETLGRMHMQYPDLQVIMMTGYASIESAIAVMKKGAFDLIEKPFHLDQVATAVGRAIEHRNMHMMLSVYELSRVVFETMDLDALLKIMARNMRRIISADEVSLFVRHAGQDWHSVVPPESSEVDWTTDHRTLAALFQPTLTDAREPFLASAEILSNVPGVVSALICPLHTDGEWQGLLLAVRRAPQGAFLPLDIRHATIFASFGTQAVRNARLYDQLVRRWKELDEAHQALQSAQQNLVQQEKMAAIGQLAAGVAHELNNPMTGIMGFSQMLCGDMSLSPQQHEDVQTIYSQSQRCKKIIENLLQFSRRSEAQPQVIDLRLVIESALELTRYEKTSPVAMECTIPSGLFVRADFTALQHLFLNLLTNARQALQGRSDAKIRVSAQMENGWISVYVADNGPGIAPEHLDKIFEPFFTTKPAGLGTGLGLSLCQSIVKSFGGRLRVESRPGDGAIFTVELPNVA